MSSSPVEQIKSRLDIAEVVGGYVKLQKAGINLKGLCPFHAEKTPSFFVSPARQTWHCFGCNKGGDIFTFLQESEGVDFSEALRIFAQRAGVELKHEAKEVRDARSRLFDANELSVQFFETQLQKSDAGKKASAYLSGRGLNVQTVQSFRLGWAPERDDALQVFLRSRGFSDAEIAQAGLTVGEQRTRDRFRGRIMFPIVDGSNRVVGFTGRIFGRSEGEYDPKYLNTSETPIFEKSHILYGLHAARKAIRREGKAIFVEGQMDCLLAHQAGTENVVATSGTALSAHHIATIKRLTDTVIFAYDADGAGVEAAKRGIELALEQGLSVRVAIVPSGKDPAELILHDAQQWQKLVSEGTKPIVGFLLQQALAAQKTVSAEGKRAVVSAVLPILSRIANAVERSEWVGEVASRVGVREESLWEELNKVRKAPHAEPFAPAVVAASAPLSRRQLLEEHLLALLLAHGIIPPPYEPETLLTSETARILHEPLKAVLAASHDGFSKRLAAFAGAVPETHRTHGERIAFSAEEAIGSVRDLSAEIASCVREMKALDLRDRLDAISLELKAAEHSGDNARARELSEQFREYTAHLSLLFQGIM